MRTGREHVRIASDLERLPRVLAEFSAGRLSFSKVRAPSRMIVEPETEADLVEMALAATASQLDILAAGCRRVRRTNDPEREQRIHDERRLSVVLDEDGSGRLSLRGPADLLAPDPQTVPATTIVVRVDGTASGKVDDNTPARARTDRRAPILEKALERAQTASGYRPGPSTIATALGDRLDRTWAIGAVCHIEEVLQRRRN